MRTLLFVTLLSSVACTTPSGTTTGTSEDTITRAQAGTCTPDLGEAFCALAPPRCPTGTTAGIANGCWNDFCIPNADCNTNADPGTCGGTVECNLAPPLCPSGTKAGVHDGCWSGYCIPEYVCDGSTGAGSGSGSGSGLGGGSGSGGGV